MVNAILDFLKFSKQCVTALLNRHTQVFYTINVVAHQDGVPTVDRRAVGHALLTAALEAAPAPVPAPFQVVLAKLHLGIQNEARELSISMHLEYTFRLQGLIGRT